MTSWEVPSALVPIQVINMTHHPRNAKNLARSPAQTIDVSGRITFWDVHNVLAMR